MLRFRPQYLLLVTALCLLVVVAVMVTRPKQSGNGQRMTPSISLLYTVTNKTKLKSKYHPLTQKDIQSVEKFLFFTGYPRSGHSIVGSLIDAHPNIVLSYGYFLFRKLTEENEEAPSDKNELFQQIYQRSFKYSKVSGTRDRKGYTLDVPGGWSGRFQGSLKIIGDKSAKASSLAYNQSSTPSEFKSIYRRLQSLVKVSLLVIHVVRNPFDMIATHALYQASQGRVQTNLTVDNSELLGNTAAFFFDLAHAVFEMVPLCNMTVLEIHDEDLVRNPVKTVTRICNFLGVECPARYLDACVRKVFPEVSKTRDRVKWPPSLRSWIEEQMHKYPFFHRYL